MAHKTVQRLLLRAAVEAAVGITVVSVLAAVLIAAVLR